MTKPVSLDAESWFSLPEPFAWGFPKFDSGIVFTSVITSVLLLINLIASIDVVEKAVHRPPQSVYNRSGLVMGINHILAGLFSSIGCVPNSHSAGFIMTINHKSRIPFMIGSGAIVLMSLFPAIPVLFSTLPTPVAYAVVVLPFANILMVGLKEIAKSLDNDQNMFIVGLSLMVGVGSMLIPSVATVELPHYLIPLMNNGLILGVLTCIGLEQTLKLWDKHR